MAANDVFNPNTGFSEALGFNPNWNYGSPRKNPANYATQRPRFGIWATRSIGGAGYTFDLTFVDRPIEQVWYIKRFYEQFQTGFFTLIDYDNNGRNHVGRFTSYSDDTETANIKYTVKVTFEDVPGAPMITYPSDFTNGSHMIYAVDDFVQDSNGLYRTLIGTSGANWAFQQQPAGGSTSDPSTYEAIDVGAVAGDFAQIEYVGWGFQMCLRCDLSFGQADLYVDGMLAATQLDLCQGTAASLAPGVTLTPNGPFTAWPTGGPGIARASSTLVSLLGLPLGRHRVKLVALGTKLSYLWEGIIPGGATNTSIAMQSIQVIH